MLQRVRLNFFSPIGRLLILLQFLFGSRAVATAISTAIATTIAGNLISESANDAGICGPDGARDTRPDFRPRSDPDGRRWRTTPSALGLGKALTIGREVGQRIEWRAGRTPDWDNVPRTS